MESNLNVAFRATNILQQQLSKKKQKNKNTNGTHKLI